MIFKIINTIIFLSYLKFPWFPIVWDKASSFSHDLRGWAGANRTFLTSPCALRPLPVAVFWTCLATCHMPSSVSPRGVPTCQSHSLRPLPPGKSSCKVWPRCLFLKGAFLDPQTRLALFFHMNSEHSFAKHIHFCLKKWDFWHKVHTWRIITILKYYFTAPSYGKEFGTKFGTKPHSENALIAQALRTLLGKNSVAQMMSTYASLKILCCFTSVCPGTCVPFAQNTLPCPSASPLGNTSSPAKPAHPPLPRWSHPHPSLPLLVSHSLPSARSMAGTYFSQAVCEPYLYPQCWDHQQILTDVNQLTGSDGNVCQRWEGEGEKYSAQF